MIERLVNLVFADWETVKSHLLKIGIEITEVDNTQVCINPDNPSFKVGFDWETLDVFTRGHQLQFLLFGGRMFLDLKSTIEQKYKEKKASL
jgi:hypothetical protein